MCAQNACASVACPSTTRSRSIRIKIKGTANCKPRMRGYCTNVSFRIQSAREGRKFRILSHEPRGGPETQVFTHTQAHRHPRVGACRHTCTATLRFGRGSFTGNSPTPQTTSPHGASMLRTTPVTLEERMGETVQCVDGGTWAVTVTQGSLLSPPVPVQPASCPSIL